MKKKTLKRFRIHSGHDETLEAAVMVYFKRPLQSFKPATQEKLKLQWEIARAIQDYRYRKSTISWMESRFKTQRNTDEDIQYLIKEYIRCYDNLPSPTNTTSAQQEVSCVIRTSIKT